VSLLLAGKLGLAFVSALILTPLVIKLAPRVGAIDRPNHRKVHTQTMPRMGGLAIYLAFIITILFTQTLDGRLVGLLAGGTLIMIVGLADDIWDLAPRWKLLGQIMAALVLVLFGTQVQFVTNPLTGGVITLGIFALPLTILWVVGVTNAVNLIDGLDGLAAGVSTVAAITLALVGWRAGQMDVAVWALILAFSTLGFLRYNFHPAKLFMGDSGSMFLGYNLAALSLLSLTKSTTAFSLVIPFIILGIPILDTMCAIVRRFMGGQPIFQADKEHLHHRLLELGLSHRGTVLVIYVISGIFGISALGMTYFTHPRAMLVLFGLAVITLIGASKLGVLAPRPNSGQPPERYRGLSQ
jgi:UDP-GlcNAc:undecaprenyl-phosphate GlcNAc-1-phosphate transferase